MDVIAIVGWGLLGLGAGWLINLLASRLPWPGTLWRLPLRCHTCQQTLNWRDILPLLGYVGQRGRCHFCGLPISRRFPSTELVMAALFAGAAWRADSPAATAVLAFFISVLVLVFVIDARHRLILNRVTYPAALAALLISFMPVSSVTPVSALLGAALYGGVFALLYLLALLLYRRADALGLGDVKLAVVIGLMTGYPLAITALAAGVLLGGLVAVLALLAGHARTVALPYGTSLSAAAIAVLILAA